MKKLLLSIFALSIYVTANAQCSELFFSKYIQFGGNNKAVEIYNPTSNTINLTGYVVERWKAAGSGLISTTMNDSVHLRGTLAPFSTHVLVNGQTTVSVSPPADPDLQALANQLDNIYGTYGSSVGAPMYFKGNDCLILRKPDGSIADIFGEVGVTVTYWSTIAPYRGQTGMGKWISKGYMLVRKPNVYSGTSSFPTEFNILAEWDTITHVYPVMSRQDTLDTYSLFGFHNSDCASFVGVNEAVKTVFASVFPNPSTAGSLTVVSSEMIENVKIYNLTGQMVQATISLNKYDFSLNTENMSKGTYIIAVTTKSGLIQREKIAIQ